MIRFAHVQASESAQKEGRMDPRSALIAMSTPSVALRYAAAFFFVVVAIAAAYALFKAAKALERVDKVLADVDEQGMPLMQKAGATLDGVNANLGNVDEITKDVAGITDKLDTMANAVEGAVSAPARKAAAFSAGVQGAVSSLLHRDKPAGAPSSASSYTPPSATEYTPPAAGPAAAAAEPSDAAVEPGSEAAAEPESVPAQETPTPPADPPTNEA
jgi:uncharacterized protein YoxC